MNIGRQKFDFSDNQILKCNVPFSYLGDRNYIDISTVNLAIRTALKKFDAPVLNSFCIRIQKPVLTDGILNLCRAENRPCLTTNTLIKANLQLGDQNYFCWIEPTDQIINLRKPETLYKYEDYFNIKKNCISLKKPFNDDLVYNLMKMGKAIIVNSGIGLNPRVAETDHPIAPTVDQFTDFKMQLTQYRGKLFYLNTHLHSVLVNRVIVVVPN